MIRTTIALDERLLKRLKEAAAREGRTLGEIVNDLLRQALTSQRTPHTYKFKPKGWDAQPLPGVDILDRDKLFDLMDGR